MLADCDFALIALPLTAETRHLFNRWIFAAIKPGACLINVSAVIAIDESALEHAQRQVIWEEQYWTSSSEPCRRNPTLERRQPDHYSMSREFQIISG